MPPSEVLSRSIVMYQAILLGAAVLFAAGVNAADPALDAAAAHKSARTPHPQCLQHTGSRIAPSADRPCVNAPGQVYTREDLERTGAIDTAEALRRLSPIIN
jgi:outer membrane cobalamin receptor